MLGAFNEMENSGSKSKPGKKIIYFEKSTLKWRCWIGIMTLEPRGERSELAIRICESSTDRGNLKPWA